MFSFWGRFFLYLLLGFVFLLVSVYAYWVFWYHSQGAPWGDSFLWFMNSNFRFIIRYTFGLGLWAFLVGVFASSVFFIGEMGELSRYENLRERSNELEKKVSALTQKEKELRGRVGALQKEKGSLSASVSDLRKAAEVLKSEVLKLEEKRRNLDKLIKKALEKGYKEGHEKAYSSVIEELRSLRAQKSALVDLFNREREFRECFKRVTGMKLLQFLNAAKKRAKES